MMRLANIILPSIAAYCFWQWVVFSHMTVTLAQTTSALSIFIAAVLVRLARGMPTLDWKSIPIASRKNLTGHLIDVSREYAGLLVLLMLLLVSAVLVGGADSVLLSAPEKAQRAASALIGFLVVLSVLRFSYVVWRDLDIVMLQKKVIDGMADQEFAAKNAEIAAAKLEKMREAKVGSGMNVLVETLGKSENEK